MRYYLTSTYLLKMASFDRGKKSHVTFLEDRPLQNNDAGNITLPKGIRRYCYMDFGHIQSFMFILVTVKKNMREIVIRVVSVTLLNFA